MCVKLANEIMRHKLNSSCALVLRTLAIRQNPRHGFSWPTLVSIAFDSNGMSKSTAQRAINDMVTFGVVQKARAKVPGRRRLLTVYIVRRGAPTVVWDRTQSWRKFVEAWKNELAQRERLPGETKTDFVKRQRSRKPAGK